MHFILKLQKSLYPAFKTRLDKFWTFQDVKYDYTVDLTGTGARSEFDTENY